MNNVNRFALAVLMMVSSINLAHGQDDNRIFFVKVAKANALQGQIIEMSELEVSSSFGDIKIPVNKIEAIKMRADNQNSAIIALVNGDMIIGKINIDELHLKTAWGKAHINGDALESISTSQNGRFYTDPSGGGWRYSRGSIGAGGGFSNGSDTRFGGFQGTGQ